MYLFIFINALNSASISEAQSESYFLNDGKMVANAVINTTKEFVQEGVKKVQLTFGDFHEFSSKYFEKLKAKVKPKLEAARDNLCKNENNPAEMDDSEVENDISISDLTKFFKNNFLTKTLCTYGMQSEREDTQVSNISLTI